MAGSDVVMTLDDAGLPAVPVDDITPEWNWRAIADQCGNVQIAGFIQSHEAPDKHGQARHRRLSNRRHAGLLPAALFNKRRWR
jgi:hypothetical protein